MGTVPLRRLVRRTHKMDDLGELLLWLLGIVVLAILVVALMWGCPRYNVWQQGLAGEAALRRAEWDRQTSVEGNESYLRYLWIDHLDKVTGQIVYVPTEAGLPILEAGRGVKHGE